MIRALALFGLLLFTSWPAGSVLAADARTEAKAHSDLATISFERGNYAQAIAEYELAFKLAPIPAILFNIGRCLEKSDKAGAAADAYERYLAAEPNAAAREELLVLIPRLRAEAALVPMPAPAPVVSLVAPRNEVHRSRKGLWIGLGVGAAVVVGAAVAVGIVFGTARTDYYMGNITPGSMRIAP